MSFASYFKLFVKTESFFLTAKNKSYLAINTPPALTLNVCNDDFKICPKNKTS